MISIEVEQVPRWEQGSATSRPFGKLLQTDQKTEDQPTN